MVNPFVTNIELLVLTQLRDKPQGLYGLELVKNSGGRLKRGTVYVTLMRLEDKGFVQSHVQPAAHAGLPRPRYTLTAPGKRVLEAADLVGISVPGVYA